MPQKPVEIPPAVVHAFVEDMRDFFAEDNAIKRNDIAARQLHALNEYRRPGEGKLRLLDIKVLFLRMRHHA
jgi:hypothetical protein